MGSEMCIRDRSNTIGGQSTEQQITSGGRTDTPGTIDDVCPHKPTVQDAAEPLRRSSRHRKPPGEWWKASDTSHVPSESETALSAKVTGAPQSYAEATSSENIDFWMPGIKRERKTASERMELLNSLKESPG